MKKKLITFVTHTIKHSLSLLHHGLKSYSELNCRWNHPYYKHTRPVNGKYTYLICLREYESPFK